MIRRVWENLKPSFEESFIDGLPAAITAKSLRERQFWWIALALGTIVSFYHCYLILESSLGQNTVTKVQLDPINGTLYPVLTICDNSGQYFLKVDEIQRLNISNAEIAQAILSLPIQTTEMGADELIDASKHLITRTRILDQTQDNITRAITFLSLVEKAGVSCKDLFQLCQDYNGANISCCDAFAPVFTMNYGLCYAPNSSLLPQVHASGAFSELYIQLHMHKTWDISGSTKPSLALFFDTGVYQGLFKADVMVILPKYTLAVWVSVQRATLSENSGICSPVEKLEYFSDYTFTNCMTERRYLQNPNWNLTCQLPIVTLVRWGLNMTKKQMDTGDRECSLHEILENIYNSSGKTLSLTDWQRNLRMAESNVCPPLCDSVIYTFNRVPTKNFQSSNDAAISLIFTESYHTHAIEVSALSSWDYLSLIGGTIGLYIGASLISILHICASLFLAFARSRRQLI